MAGKKLFLLDGHALVYRAHYAFISRPLINSKGMNTGAISGFVRTLWDIIKNQSPSHLAVAFDLATPTFRHKMFPEYKAHREAQPEDITIALPYIHKIIDAFNIPVVTREGYEADDVIGTLAKKAEADGFDVYMVTPDKDFAQLVSDKVKIYKPSRQGNGVDILGIEEVLAKWEIARVDQVIDILGLQGDSSDNIPGIPGVGAKTAVKLLAQFDSIENLLQNTDQLKGKQKEKIEEFADQGRLSRELATICLDVPIPFDETALRLDSYDRKKLIEIFKDLEFRTLATQILGDISNEGKQGALFGATETEATATHTEPEYSIGDQNVHTVEHDYILVNDEAGYAKLSKALNAEKSFCFDTETTGIDPNTAELVGIAFSWEAHKAYYIPLPEDREEVLAILAYFKGVLESADIEKVGQNIKYDMLILKWYGIEVAGPLYDTMIAHYLLEPDTRHKLDILSENYLNYKPVPITDLIGKRGKNQLSMRDVPLDKVVEYAAEDADLTWQLKSVFSPMMTEREVLKIFESIELPLIDVLVQLEYNGVRVNADFLREYSVDLQSQILEAEKGIYTMAGVRFNISSPKQVGDVLFERLKIPYRWRKTKSGQYSTNEEKLKELASQNEIVDQILEYRKLSKLKSTYVDALPQLINPKTGRIHSSFNQARAATGRLSSENPNLQNIPIRDEAGRHIRKAFEARDDAHILLAADYSQIELRLIAEISAEENMLDAFQQNLDIHRATASRVYGVPYEKVDADQRRNAKTVNFSIIYGAGATNLSRQLNIKRTEASELIQAYFEQYPGLKKYMESTVDFARENAYVTTLLGRRRYLRDILSRSGLERSNAERMAINTPIQGTAADMIKLAMIDIHRAFIEEKMESKMIMQVHDELVFDIYTPELEKARTIIEHHMKNAIPDLKVPIQVGMGIGKNWLEAH